MDKKLYMHSFPLRFSLLKFFKKTPIRKTQWFKELKDEMILNYLNKNFTVYDFSNEESQRAEKIIWTMWNQGIEQAPDIVKMCYKSMEKYKPDGFKVVVITDSNIDQYIQLPDYIYEKYQKGLITPTHFSDIVRVALLTHYGGLWLDATVLVTQKINPKIVDTDFFSINGYQLNLLPFTKDKWALFTIGTNRSNYIIKNLYYLLLDYWEKYDVMIDYYLIDYLLGLSKRNNKSINYAISANPINNQDIFALTSLLENTQLLDEQELSIKLNDILNSRTYLHKLTYKKEYNNKLIEILKEEVLR